METEWENAETERGRDGPRERKSGGGFGRIPAGDGRSSGRIYGGVRRW
jgi:hypothetical protein